MKTTILLLSIILFASCEKTITKEIETSPAPIVEDTLIIESDTLYGVYDVFYIKGIVEESEGSYLADYKKHDYIIDFNNSMLEFDREQFTFEYIKHDDTLMIDCGDYVPTMDWFSKCLIVEYGDTLILEPLEYGTNLTIKLERK